MTATYGNFATSAEAQRGREGGREGLGCGMYTTAALDKRQLRPFVGEREPTVRAARAHGDVPSQCCAAHRAVVAPVPGCAGKGCSCKRLHAPCTRKARAMHGKRHAVGGSPSGTCPWKPGRTCHPPRRPYTHQGACRTLARRPGSNAVRRPTSGKCSAHARLGGTRGHKTLARTTAEQQTNAHVWPRPLCACSRVARCITYVVCCVLHEVTRSAGTQYAK